MKRTYQMPNSQFLVARIIPTLVITVALILGACDDASDSAPEATAPADSSRLVATVTGFSGPEAVRYDPDQDVYFVASFNGPGSDADNNGFISRVGPDGTVDSLHFIQGGSNGVTLHAPRGMAISGDTLWVADHQAVRGFDRVTGELLREADFADQGTGFLNDVTVGPDGIVYVTDTGTDRVFRISGSNIEVAFEDSVLNMPNGITWDDDGNRFIVVPYGGTHSFSVWAPGADSLQSFANSPGAKFDGVEVVGTGELIVASQEDSSLHLVTEEESTVLIALEGRPADIGYDPSRNRVAVPYIDRNLVEIWQLP